MEIEDLIVSEENQALLMRLLNDPGTVDFIVRMNTFTEKLIQSYEIAVAYIVAGRYLIAYAREEVFLEFRSVLGAGAISAISIVLGPLDRPALEASGITQVHRQPFLDLQGQGVIVGIVDTGIDYTLDTFRYEDGTSKILSIFDQTVEGEPPPGYYIGVEYTHEQINAALASDNPQDIVPVTDPSGHGTFLASIAAGREDNGFVGAAPDADLIVVKLRKARPYYLNLFSVPPEQENAFESNAIILGIDYIIQRATALNRPVAICLGLGSNFGTHTSFSIFEEYLSDIANLAGVALCIAAGNESQARHHTMGIIAAPGETYDIDIKVGENAGDIFISIWTGVSDRISVSIRSPTGELVPRVPARSGFSYYAQLILERSAVNVSYFFPIEGLGGQLTAVKIIDALPGYGHYIRKLLSLRAVPFVAAHDGICQPNRGVSRRQSQLYHYGAGGSFRRDCLRRLQLPHRFPFSHVLLGSHACGRLSSRPCGARRGHCRLLSGRERHDVRHQRGGGHYHRSGGSYAAMGDC